MLVIRKLNSTQTETLKAIFHPEMSAKIQWKKAQNLLIALGASIKEGEGSAVVFSLNNRRFVVHKPHPGKEISKHSVRGFRSFIESNAQYAVEAV